MQRFLRVKLHFFHFLFIEIWFKVLSFLIEISEKNWVDLRWKTRFKFFIMLEVKLSRRKSKLVQWFMIASPFTSCIRKMNSIYDETWVNIIMLLHVDSSFQYKAKATEFDCWVEFSVEKFFKFRRELLRRMKVLEKLHQDKTWRKNCRCEDFKACLKEKSFSLWSFLQLLIIWIKTRFPCCVKHRFL